jgi:hypothetical protein
MDVTNLVHTDTLKESTAGGFARAIRRPFSGTFLESVLREPLVHFLVLGGLLFLFFQWKGAGSGPGSNRIVVTHAQIEQLAVGFARTWQKPPTEQELKGLIDEYVKDEIATREAVAMGLDRDDVIIRRRLRQKLEFIAEDTVTSVPPSDVELAAWMVKHPTAFQSEPKLAFRQVYLNPDRHGTALQADAEKLLARLQAGGAKISAEHLGDTTMLPAEQPLAPLFDTARSFGDDFANELMKLQPGQWVGPLESPFGLHLVLVSEKVPASQQQLAAVRPQVEREVLLEHKRKELQNLYDRLLEKYTVKVEQLPAEPGAAGPSGGATK